MNIKKFGMKEQRLPTREMLLNISSMKSNAMKLLKQNKAYSKLLDQILKYDFIFDDEKPVPAIKDIVKASGLKYEAVRKQIFAIYHYLILGDEEMPVFSFPKVSYSFFIRGLNKDRILNVRVNKLSVMPRVGEEFNLPFFSAYVGTTHFYVEKIEHEFDDEMQEIVIWLREGNYNSYWHYRKDKAKEENEVSLFDFLQLEEWELKRKLKIGRH